MLTSQDTWKHQFDRNYSLIPHPETISTNSSALPRFASLVGVKYPYQLVFSFIENIPIPDLSNQSQIEIFLRVSLFDIESAQFFGKTWESGCIWKKADKRQRTTSDNSDDSIKGDITGTKLNIRVANQEMFSIGWTLLHLFDVQRGGLNVIRAWEDELNEDQQNLDLEPKVVPLFTGTPRILPFIASILLGSNLEAPAITPLVGASLRYHFIPRPDVRNACYLWKQNIIIGPNMNIPGISSISIREISLIPTSRACISSIHVSATPSVEKYEQMLLDRIAAHHFEADPESMTPNPDGQLDPPIVLERRLHFGFHNTFAFLHQPIVINLHPAESSINGQDLLFLGSVEVDKYLNIPGVALVFMVEYKVALTVNAQKETPKKTLMSILAGSPTATTPNGVETLEKFFCVGWGACNIFDRKGVIEGCSLDCSSTANPFSSLVYRATSDIYIDSKNVKMDEVSNGKELFLNLAFFFNPNNEMIIEAHPTEVKIIEDVKEISIIPKEEYSRPVIREDTNLIQNENEEQEIIETINPGEYSYVDLPIPPKSNSRPRISRVEKARLLKAGFEKVFDQKGEILKITDLEKVDHEKSQINMELEFKDNLMNDITFTFMGMTFSEDYLSQLGGKPPTSVYFSFQFYNFPYLTTERARVYTGDLPPIYEKHSPNHARSVSVPQHHTREWSHVSQKSFQSNRGKLEQLNDDQQWPAILYKVETDGRAAFDRHPGIKVEFVIDPYNEVLSAQSNRCGPLAFPAYMAQKQLFIDVWDGESMIFLGSGCIDMSIALRQGKPGILVEDNLDIIWTHVNDLNQHSRSSSFSSTANRPFEMSEKSLHVGSIHLRIANIGREPMDPLKKGYTSNPALKESCIVYDYHEKLEHHHAILNSKKLVDVDGELFAVLAEAQKERIASKMVVNPEPNDHKSERVRKAYKILEQENIIPGIKERERDLKTIEIFRERRKRHVISDSLKISIKTVHTINSSFGQGHFFEFVFMNPFNTDQLFDIEWENDLVRIVLNEKEWRHHRKTNGLVGGVEKNMAQLKPNGTVQLFLQGREKISIPFVYQSFRDQSTFTTYSNQVRLSNDHDDSRRIIPITFSRNQVPIAILELLINPKNFYIDKSIRLFRCENDLINKTIRFPAVSKVPMTTVANQIRLIQQTDEKYLKCSNPDVVCQLDWRNEGNFCQIKFKYRASQAGDVVPIYFILYNDAYCTSVYEIWRVFVHSLARLNLFKDRLDINCIIGQTNATSLVVRGPSMSRNVSCFTNHPQNVLFGTPSPFKLMANSLSEVVMYLRPSVLNSEDLMVNIVDIDTQTLINSWLLVVHATLPNITKVFDIVLPKGKSSNKRVSYTNPFLHQKALYLATDSPDLLQFKESTMLLEAGATQFIGLKFAPCSTLPTTEILVYLNNEYDRIEECLKIRVRYD